MSIIESKDAPSAISNRFDVSSLGLLGDSVGALNPSQRDVVAEWQGTAEDSRPPMATTQARFTALFEENRSPCELRVTSESPQREITVLHQVAAADAPVQAVSQVAAVWQEAGPVSTRMGAAETRPQAADPVEAVYRVWGNRFEQRLKLMEGEWL